MNLTCPAPFADDERVQLAHGGGGRRMAELIDGLFLPAFGEPGTVLHDGAVVDPGGGRVALSTDAYVVHPRFFPGGDIGALAVHGTVNDLAACGARARWLTAAFVLEEGLPMEELRRVVASMAAAARATGVRIVTGDTKVVDRGQADGLYITTAGVGVVAAGDDLSPGRIRENDAILVSGDIGRHGIAIMALREGLAFDTTIDSDCGDVAPLVFGLLDAGVGVHCARDLTRGGLSSALVELARATGRRFDVDESAVPVDEAVRGACEVLGLDPFYVACEGRICLFVAGEEASRALEILRGLPGGEGACRIGHVGATHAEGRVVARGLLGVERVVELFSGEQLPRIC